MSLPDQRLDDDMRVVLEEMPLPIFRALAQALRDLRVGGVNQGLMFQVDGSRGGGTEWRVERKLTERLTRGRRYPPQDEGLE